MDKEKKSPQEIDKENQKRKEQDTPQTDYARTHRPEKKDSEQEEEDEKED